MEALETRVQRPVDASALDEVVAETAQLVPARPQLAAGLARAMYRRTDVLPPWAAQRVAAALVFMDRRPSGTLAVRVFDPSVADHGYTTPGTLVEVSVEDRPFLLTTVTEELRRLGLATVAVLHPIVGVERDGNGALVGVRAARTAALRETLLHVELADRLDDERRGQLARDLTDVLNQVLAVTGDFQAMIEQLEDVAFALRAAAGAAYSTDEVDESSALLHWLLEGNFILLGSASWDLDAAGPTPQLVLRASSALGITGLEGGEDHTVHRPRVAPGRLVRVSRTGRVSRVHRRVRMIAVDVCRVDDSGTAVGEHRLVGLFAQRAFAEPASTTPVLRRTLQWILEREDIVDHSHDERQLRALFEAFPKHELFAIDREELRATLVALLAARRRQDVRVLVRGEPATGSLSVLVALPRDRFSAVVRQRVQQLLVDRFGPVAVDYHLSLDDQDQALLQFALRLADPGPAHETVDATMLDELERAVSRIARNFADDLLTELRRSNDAALAARMVEAFVPRLPASYTETTAARVAARDLDELRRLEEQGPVRVVLRQDPADPPQLYRLRLYRLGAPVELSDFLPILESLGLTVTAEVSHRIAPPARPDAARPGTAIHLHDFGFRADRNLYSVVAVDVERDGPRLAEAVQAMLRGEIEVDSLNRLVLAAGLRVADVEVLRVYRQYRQQVGTTFTPRFIDDALVAHPDIAAGLVGLFAARFDPARLDRDRPDTAEVEETAHRRVLERLAGVQRFDADRILRGFLGLVDATLRTNRYAPRRLDGSSAALALKFASARVPEMPRPVPAVEVFVAGGGVQGIHLRGGPVARGGLRWSDRREDFRTEVLGLMKAQMTKNAVIVPTGSKGGFVLTRTGLEPLAVADEVRGAYVTFVRALLDVTDNVVGDEVLAPPGVRRRDGDDPYLVVAADRGTATFSDLANAISTEYGFWLDDAFASGGSSGYDHKAMGITARGAWLAVRRHFRELDIDVDTEPVSVAGIGDMSGDVFGNGMLQSRAVQLVAAFDHRDIFLDPEPDPATAYRERQRLFALPISSWRDYDRAAISPGGGVWSRTVREIPLSPQVRAVLHVTDQALSPPALIRAILRAPVDLLFAGGIGTFARATTETNLDVGDRANDAVRLPAVEIGARVVGEGGNLAFTQRARIQYARRGGRINTDAIDNAGGVATSDREVNLKILLGYQGSLGRQERDALLAAVQDDVATAVLRDVDLQTAAVSAEVPVSPALLDSYEALMVDLEEAGRLDRDVEALPSTAEMLRRREVGAGFSRPELAVLLGYAKVDHVARLLLSDLPDQPWLRPALDAYFPRLVVERFGALIDGHRLRRELVATLVANQLVDRMGVTYVSRTAHELGCMAWEVAAAWWAAREVTGADQLWDLADGLGPVAALELQAELRGEVDLLVDTVTRTYLRHRVGSDIGAVVARDRPAFLALAEGPAQAPPGRQAARSLRLQTWVDLGVEPAVAGRFAGLRDLSIVPDVAGVAEDSGHPVAYVGELFWRLSEVLALDDLHARLSAVRTTGSWQYWQKRGLADELREVRRAGGAAVTRSLDDDPAKAVARFLAERADARERVRVLLLSFDREPDPGLDGLAVAVRALRTVVGDQP